MSNYPLSDYRSTKRHTADECKLELCGNCGCCVHGMTRAGGCPMDDAPWGSQCSNGLCGCEGRS